MLLASEKGNGPAKVLEGMGIRVKGFNARLNWMPYRLQVLSGQKFAVRWWVLYVQGEGT